MWIECTDSDKKERYQVIDFLKEENRLYVNRGKGFPLRCGIVEKDGIRYFIKFVLNEECTPTELKHVRKAFERELKFQVRYPYIVYVESLRSYQLHMDEEDWDKAEWSEFSETVSVIQSKFGQRIELLCLMEEFVEGESLEKVYADFSEKVSEKIMFRHMHQLLNGMCSYYERYRKDPLIHRDIKPSNIIVSPDLSAVKYVDFDLAHVFGSVHTMQMGGLGQGTPGYAHPRQSAINGGVSDIRSDFYSLGMTFLYMLCGDHYMAMVCEMDDNAMGGFHYLMDLKYRPLLYHVKREAVKRNGQPVFQETRYDGLFRIINRMITNDEDLDYRGFKSPREALEVLELFLRGYYGIHYSELYQDDSLLSRNLSVSGMDARLQFYTYGEGSNILILKENEVYTLSDRDYGELAICYMSEGKIFCQFTVQNMVPLSGMIHTGNNEICLTEIPFEFTIKNRRYRLKVISNGIRQRS